MRILYSHRTKSADGQYVHIRSLTEALCARGHAVFMAGPDDFGAPAPRALDAAAGAGNMRGRLPRGAAELAELVYTAPAYVRLARAERQAMPEILYERYNLFFHSGAILSRRRNLPFLLEVNAPLAEERRKNGGLAMPGLARASERAIWRSADAVLPITSVLARMIEEAGVSPKRLHVVPNGVDSSFLKDIDPSPVRARYGLEGKLVIGFAGFVRDWHRVDRALSYLAASGRDDLHLLLVGDGDALADLEATARRLGVSDRFSVTGVVQRDAMPAHIAAFDIALQPAATAYASPLKLFEYMALGKAILAPAADNIREILTDGADALLFEDNDASFSQTLGALIADPALRARLGAGARATVISRDLTWAGNAARVERIAEGLLRRQR